MSSLEKSHSKISNFELSIILILTLIFVTILWLGIALASLEPMISIALIIIGLIGSIIGGLLINKFKR